MLSNFKHSVDNTKARLVSLWGDEEQRFEARDVLWTADRITDAPCGLYYLSQHHAIQDQVQRGEGLQSVPTEAEDFKVCIFTGGHIFYKLLFLSPFINCDHTGKSSVQRHNTGINVSEGTLLIPTSFLCIVPILRRTEKKGWILTLVHEDRENSSLSLLSNQTNNSHK